MAWSPLSVLDWLLGEEGSVATEAEMQVVMLSIAAAVTGVYLVSPILAAIAGPFGVSKAAVGQLVTAYTAPSILFVPVFGVLADRYGRRPVLTVGLLLFGLAGGAIALVHSFAVALVLRLVQGVGFAAINPIGVTIIGDVYDGNREATAQGLRVGSAQTAGLLVPPIAGVLVLSGWQYPFLLYLLALPIAAWAWLALPTATRPEPASLGHYLSDIRSSLASPALGLVVVSFTARFALSFSFIAYVSVLLDAIGASSVETGVVVGLMGFASLVASTQAGRVTEFADHALVLCLGFLAIALGMGVMGLGGSYAVELVAVVVYAVGIGISGPVQKSLVNRRSPPAVRAGTVSSAMWFQSIGAAVGPLAMGVALQYVGVGVTFVLFGVGFGGIGAVLSAVAYLAGARRRARPHA